MHFWIDKRSQYTYTGRHRMPTTLSSGGVGRGRARVYNEVGVGVGVGRKPRSARRPPTAARRSRSNGRQNSQPVPVHGAARRSDASAIYMAVPPEPLPSIASLAAARCVTPDTLLRTAALGLPAPVMAPHLKFGMLVSFALATLFLAGAKYYFDRPMIRDPRAASPSGVTEAALVLAGIATAGALGCVLLRCRPKAAPLQDPVRITSTARVPPPTRPATTSTTITPTSEPSPSDDVSINTLELRPSSPEAPPPYHIAVLLPPRELPPREASPPHYSDINIS